MQLPSETALTIGFERPDGISTIRPFVAPEFPLANAMTMPTVPDNALPRVGVEYYAGKRKPFRAYVEAHGKKSYCGYFAKEADAWGAATAQILSLG